MKKSQEHRTVQTLERFVAPNVMNIVQPPNLRKESSKSLKNRKSIYFDLDVT